MQEVVNNANSVAKSCFVYAQNGTHKILAVTEKDVMVFEDAYVIHLPNTPFFTDWWNYKIVNGEVVRKSADDPVDELNASKLEGLRMARQSRLTESDWTQFEDSPLSAQEKAQWTTYRQALRDITNTYSSLDDVVWPVKP